MMKFCKEKVVKEAKSSVTSWIKSLDDVINKGFHAQCSTRDVGYGRGGDITEVGLERFHCKSCFVFL